MRAALLIGVLLLALVVAPHPSAAQTPTPLAPQWPSAAAVRITVTQAGMQRISGSALQAVGLNLAALPPASLRIRRFTTAMPIEVIGAADGRFDPEDEIRFWVASVGDRWNRHATFWLDSTPATPSPRIAALTLSALPNPQTIGWELSSLPATARYDSRRAGPDGDHWFAPVLNLPSDSLVFTPTAHLPISSGILTVTLRGDTSGGGDHGLVLRMGESEQTVRWTGFGQWQQSVVFPRWAAPLRVFLASGSGEILLDSVAWQRPAHLQFDGRGGTIGLTPGNYRLSGLTADAAIYDITDARRPLRLLGSGSSRDLGVPAGLRRFLIGGSSTMHTPALSTYTPPQLPAPEVLLIAPPALQPALAPLIALRQAQGFSVGLIDPQAAYDGWNGGDVHPEAIRSMLRFSASQNSNLRAVLLVGDGSLDPHNYTNSGELNVTLIPPYMADVDPLLIETACDTCYVRFDRNDVRDDPLPDLLIGRLPVRNASELERLIGKIVAYEQLAQVEDWRSRAIFLTDDTDAAGDFAAMAEAAIQRMPAPLQPQRIFYDPAGGANRIADPELAFATVQQQLSAGAALVTYIGHSNQWQWASTDPTVGRPYLMGLYDPDVLANKGRPFVALAMTCLSGAFQTPARSGTTLDERMLLAEGGAVAIWGASGLGVARGHDQLQAGFYAALAAAPLGTARVGDLVQSGYAAVADSCCPDAAFTFNLLGDPLTRLRIAEPVAPAAPKLYLPLLRATF